MVDADVESNDEEVVVWMKTAHCVTNVTLPPPIGSRHFFLHDDVCYIMGSASSPPPTTEEDEDDDPMPGLILMGDAADCCSCCCKIHALAKIRAKL
ncbi:hypothetical protein C8F04DRAFT_1257956 [Mycena alexandri]|uniref:Uncharacterized protein n=1 Tax=Mycena alexandri TaxID=1745969 RepID=A0AAD6SZK2_9AGAR|nr:hypothetical protein C8F04DRAFT_1257956 [Mycena alexandri]